MTSDGLVLYKLMILYMLDRSEFPLTVSQISQFILEFNSTAFFDIQIGLNELVENDFIKSQLQRNHTLYEITEQGKEAVEIFEFKIADSIKMDIINYLKDHRITLKNESVISADYYPSGDEYIAQCSVKEKNQTLLEIKIAVPTAEQAVHICDSWKDKNEQIYQYLITEIWQESD
ncbi:MAG: DUF4364 family protein [Lachnospiraceae bacterium]|nr:DUF4364 family protein [Lachnospiraceae bacterium]